MTPTFRSSGVLLARNRCLVTALFIIGPLRLPFDEAGRDMTPNKSLERTREG